MVDYNCMERMSGIHHVARIRRIRCHIGPPPPKWISPPPPPPNKNRTCCPNITYIINISGFYSRRDCAGPRRHKPSHHRLKKAIFKLKSTFKICGGVPVTLALDLFDKIILPILLYGSEIWGTKRAEHIELVHRKYCKYIIKVSSSTSNVAVLGELGRYSLHVY